MTTTKTKTTKTPKVVLNKRAFRTFLKDDDNEEDLSLLSYYVTEVKSDADYLSAELRLSTGYGQSGSFSVDLFIERDASAEDVDRQVEQALYELTNFKEIVEEFVANATEAIKTIEVLRKAKED